MFSLVQLATKTHRESQVENLKDFFGGFCAFLWLVHKSAELDADGEADGDEGGDEGGEAGAH